MNHILKSNEIIAGKPVTKLKHIIQGTGYNLVPPHWDPSLADGFTAVTDDEAREYKELLAKKKSLYTGCSAAANVCACVKLMKELNAGDDFRTVTILCDSGLKYV